MKIIPLIVATISLVPVAAEEESAEQIYFQGLREIEKEYRANFSKKLIEANRVVLYLVDFENLSEPPPDDPFGGGNQGSDGIYISTDKLVAPIIEQKVLQSEDQDAILSALAKQIEKPGHTGGPMAHFPNHGIRIYRDDRLLFSSTFSWATGNFPFSYPKGSGWLDSNAEMEKFFMEHLPMPESYLNRLDKRYPSSRKRIEQ